MLTLQKRKTDKFGGVTYGVAGVSGSAYFRASMFKGEAPDTISIDEPVADETYTDADGKSATRVAGTIFADINTKRERKSTGAVSGRAVKVNAEREQARAEAKRLREESKKVLADFREAQKAKRRGQPAGSQALPIDAPDANA
jgi:hypothetical protein